MAEEEEEEEEKEDVEEWYLLEYEGLSTWEKRIVDEICNDKRVMVFLALVYGRALQGNPMSEEEITEWYNELFPEKTEEEIKARVDRDFLESFKKFKK